MKHSLKTSLVHSCYLGYGIITIAAFFIIKMTAFKFAGVYLDNFFRTFILSVFSSKFPAPLSSLSE
jgi:hypothetical protein